MHKNSKCRVGDWVEVRSPAEILRTLDSNGQLDGMPFMPEMLQYCGERFRVDKRAHKTCDYSRDRFRTRRLKDTVHLETRCDGVAHDHCQAGCLLYWKHDWLKPVQNAEEPLLILQSTPAPSEPSSRCTVERLSECTRVAGSNPCTYICQTTQIPHATKPLGWWDIRQYIEDYVSGNVPFSRLVTGFIYSFYYHLCNARRLRLTRIMRWLYNTVNPLWGGTLYPRMTGTIPAGAPTPTVTLNLQPGELIRVKSHREILATVTTENKNRGMGWDAELVPYCGRTYRVRSRVDRLIDERTSKMVHMKTACIVLESVVCQARYSTCRMLCPKQMFPYWREVWLERVHAALEVPLALETSENKAGNLCANTREQST